MKVVRLGDRVPRSGTRIEYGSGVTFQHQDSMMRIGVSRSDTRIVYGSGTTFRYQDKIWIGCHVPVPG